MDTLSMPLMCASDSFTKQHHVLDLSELSIIAPPLVNHHHTAEEQQETSSNESSNGDAYASGSGFDTGTTATSSSTSSFSTGQLTPPFSSSSSCSCSSSLNIADHGHHHHHHNHNHEDAQLLQDNHNAADLQEEDVDDSFPNSRTSQRTASKAGPSTIHGRKSKRNSSNNVSRSDVRRYAAEIVRREAKALLDLASRLDPEEHEDEEQEEFYDDESVLSSSSSSRFSLKAPEKQHDGYSKAVELLKSMDSHGSIIMTGVGKSGLLARKAVATFNSFGIASAFLHPVEALHGDLGSISPYGVDTVILISYSGRTSELLHLLNHLRQRRVHACVSLSSPDSALAEACDVNIDVSLENDEEAEDCVPAPTSSVVTALAALDALALTLLRLKTGWHSHISERRKAFGLHHPGGSLGQQLSSTLEQT